MIGAFVGHFVGDFLLQNDWMALNKKQRAWPCIVHVTLYTLAVMLLSGWWDIWWAWPAVWVPHFAIDRSQFVKWYMQTFGQVKFAQPPMSPWSFVAVDSTMHFVCLFAVGVVVGEYGS